MSALLLIETPMLDLTKQQKMTKLYLWQIYGKQLNYGRMIIMIRSIKTRINPFEEGVFVSTNEFGKLTYLVYLDNLVFHYDNEADALEI